VEHWSGVTPVDRQITADTDADYSGKNALCSDQQATRHNNSWLPVLLTAYCLLLTPHHPCRLATSATLPPRYTLPAAALSLAGIGRRR
jgi:hypothetical protein